MHFDKLLARSAALEDRLSGFFSLPLANRSIRLQATQALASLGFEHSRSLKHLVAAGLYTSAAVLLRVQYESLVRALWVLYIAKDGQADLMLSELTQETAKQASKIPMLSQMLEELEVKAPHIPVAKLKEFKHYSWKPLSSYVHGGIHAVNRHGRGFPSELVMAQIQHSNGLLAIAGNLRLILSGVPPEAKMMEVIYTEFQDCFPAANPPYERTTMPAH